MTLLWNKYKGQEWFEAAISYSSTRFRAVENRFLIATRYVDIHGDNGKTFSYEFASILRDCGSIFGSLMDALVRGSNTVTKPESNFGDYRDYLRKEISDIHRRTLQVRPRFPLGMVVPFEALEKLTGTPEWWEAYNRIKHSEYDEFRSGNLENCVTALSALALLGFLMSWFVSDQLFVNVGGVLKEESIDMSREWRLFPSSSV
jgi:hypothetical protein